MGFRAWKQWMLSLPWSLRWFIVLILVRPVLDNFYFLKDISPFLSPLYLIGVGTPIVIVASFFSRNFPATPRSSLDQAVGWWAILSFFNACGLMIYAASIGFPPNFTLAVLDICIKLILPALIYFFVRHLVRSKRDLLGIMTTFLYSAVFPLGMLLYENVFTAISTQVSRDMVRSHGAYADILNYSIYMTGSILIVGYLFIDSGAIRRTSKRAVGLVGAGAVCLLGLLTINHAATWGVCAALVALLLFYSTSGSQLPALIFVVLVAIGGFYFIGDEISERVSTLVEVDMAVVEGQENIDRAFHGRVGRWRRYIQDWSEASPFAMLFGASLMSAPHLGMFSIGIHNDYLRILFSSGILGFICYLYAYALMLVQTWKRGKDERFLIQGAIAIMVLYSVTTLPTMYASLLYLILPIFAYAALPQPRADRPRPAPQVVRPLRPGLLRSGALPRNA